MNITHNGEPLSPHDWNDSNIGDAVLADVQLEPTLVGPVTTDSTPNVSLESVEFRKPQGPGSGDGHSPKKKPLRGSNTGRDIIWTHNHALCGMAVVGDLMLGGYKAARSEPEPLLALLQVRDTEVPLALSSLCPWPDVPFGLLASCPWLLNATYVNFPVSVPLDLQSSFLSWAADRVDSFFRKGSKQHPAYKAYLRTVYRPFYDRFAADFHAKHFVPEEAAQAFWVSVACDVPFIPPPAS